ncbi:oligopeptide transporter ATP-binding component [Salinisphaera shabanensis T35B1]|uniref:ABC transporter ATP-binding protein n=1 Tax=Salinisphaera shabanensis TaxID=180542 RepID=UPI00333FEBDC
MLLDVRDLKVSFDTPDGVVEAVRGLDLQLAAGESVGIVGESGSGKSQSVLALMGLLADNARVSGGATLQTDTGALELIGAKRRVLERIRGARIAMIFQDPMTTLNPHLRIATQIKEVITRHRGLRGRAATKAAIEMLEAVKIPDPARRIRYYPHQFSGGMRQRVMIAMALACEPDILIADEPTTALDVTVQADILDLMAELRQRTNVALLLITHDLGVVAGQCERLLVMRHGEVVERGAIDPIFEAPAHAYTRDLLAAVPKLETPHFARASS